MDVRRTGGLDPGPFLRRDQSDQLRRSRRRRNLRRRLVVLAGLFSAGLVIGGVYVARSWLLHSPRFALRQVALSPTRHAPAADLRRALERYRGRNLFRLDLSRMERDLVACRWVKRAAVKRVLPDQVQAVVDERRPQGLAMLRGRIWLIDEDGVAIDAYGESTKEFSFPIFTGLDERDGARLARQAARGVALLADLEAHYAGLASEISEIDLSRDDRIEVHMNEGGPIVRLHAQEFGTNLDRYLAMRDYLTTNFGDAAYVDLRFRDRIAFQPLTARSH